MPQHCHKNRSLINSGSTVLVFIDKDLLIKKHNSIIKAVEIGLCVNGKSRGKVYCT